MDDKAIYGTRYPNCAFVWAVNRSGVALSGGDVVFPYLAAGYEPDGRPLSATVADVEGLATPMGAVAPQHSTVPNGAEMLVQVAGLHPGLTVDGTETVLTRGAALEQSGTAKFAQVAPEGVYVQSSVFAIYADADYAGNTAKKAGYLLNPLNLAADL